MTASGPNLFGKACMKRTANSALDCVKQLLPSLAASGLWGALGAAGPSAGPVLIPVGVCLASVAAYIGLKRIGKKKPDAEETRDLKVALDILRSRSKDAEKQLEDLGFQLKMNFENIHLRLTQLDRAVADVAELLKDGFENLDDRLEEHFRQNREHLNDLWFDLWGSFTEVNEKLDRIETHAQTGAEMARENRDLLIAYGFVPLVSSNVPPVPAKTFVDRPKPLGELVETLWASEQASLVGRAQAAAGGGYGKTVLAYHYAAAYRERYPGGVYKAACEGATVAEALDQLMPPHEGVKGLLVDERARIVRAKLSGESRALLILDNIDSAEQWREYRDSGLLPTPPCHVLVTTRAEDIHDLPAVAVDKLEPAEAVELLAKYRPSARDADCADAISTILEETERIAALVAAVGMAMAEDQSDDWPGYADWLANARLEEFPDAGAWVTQYTDYPHKTVAILDDLRRRLRPAMLRALDYAALIPADMIARGWLEALLTMESDPGRGEEALDLGRDTRGQLRAAAWHVERLKERDLLRSASADGTLWSLHRLHRKRAHDHLAANSERKRAMLLAIAGHAKTRGGWLVQVGEDNAERWVKHEHRWELGPLKALVDPPRVLDFDHADVAVCLNQVAYVLQNLGRLPEALPKYEAALEMHQRLFEGDHPNVALSLNNVASCLQSLGRSAEALPQYETALEMRQRLFEGDHPDVARSLNNVAACLESQGRSAEALPQYKAALEMRQRLFEGDHPDVAQSLNNVAFCLQSLGRSAEALLKFEAALEMRQRLFEGDHPDVAQSLYNVASCLQSLGQSEEALPMFEAALEMHRRVLPSGHPHTLYPQIGLVGILVKLGRCADAEPLLRDAAEQCKRSEASRRLHWRNVLDHFVRLYDAWHAAEPGQGYDAKAAEWRAKLEEGTKATRQPGTQEQGTATQPAPKPTTG